MTRHEQLERQIDSLAERLRTLEALIHGRPAGPITMTEARMALETGDLVTYRAYQRQEELLGGLGSKRQGAVGGDDRRKPPGIVVR